MLPVLLLVPPGEANGDRTARHRRPFPRPVRRLMLAIGKVQRNGGSSSEPLGTQARPWELLRAFEKADAEQRKRVARAEEVLLEGLEKSISRR